MRERTPAKRTCDPPPFKPPPGMTSRPGAWLVSTSLSVRAAPFLVSASTSMVWRSKRGANAGGGYELSACCCASSSPGAASSTTRLQTVVRCFSRDDDIMRMRFTQSRGRDPDELCFRVQRSDVTYPAIPHSAPQPTDHLEDDVGNRAAVGDSPLYPLRDELLQRDLTLLEIAVGRALFHGGQAAHAANHLEAPALQETRLARTLLRPRQR